MDSNTNIDVYIVDIDIIFTSQFLDMY